MTAYNEVIQNQEERCPRCGCMIRRPVQFKYGDTWQHRFDVGDRIEWGGNNVGEPGHKLVVVLGYPEECPICGDIPDSTYDVTIREDVIQAVRRSDGTSNYVANGRNYLVVEP